MKKLLFFIFLLLISPLFGIQGNPNTTKVEVTANYYICTGKYATKYHYTNSCRGLNNCKGEIKKTSDISGRSACKICY